MCPMCPLKSMLKKKVKSFECKLQKCLRLKYMYELRTLKTPFFETFGHILTQYTLSNPLLIIVYQETLREPFLNAFFEGVRDLIAESSILF